MSEDDLRQEIEHTRQRLGETVDELAAKADIKARAQAKAAEATAQARDRAAKATAQARDRALEVSGRVSRSETVRRRWPVAVAAAVLIAGTVVIWRWKQA